MQDAVCPHVHEWQAAKGLSKADLQLLLDAKSKEVEEAGWPSFDCVRSFPASPPFSFSCFRFPSKAKEVEVCDLAVFPTGPKYYLPECRHVQKRPRNATLLGPCLDCFESLS